MIHKRIKLKFHILELLCTVAFRCPLQYRHLFRRDIWSIRDFLAGVLFNFNKPKKFRKNIISDNKSKLILHHKVHKELQSGLLWYWRLSPSKAGRVSSLLAIFDTLQIFTKSHKTKTKQHTSQAKPKGVTLSTLCSMLAPSSNKKLTTLKWLSFAFSYRATKVRFFLIFERKKNEKK